MTLTKYLEHIGVNSNSYGRFTKLKGKYSGIDNGTYSGSVRFFAEREETKKKEKATMRPAEKKRKREEEKADKSSKKSSLSALVAGVAAVVLPPLPAHVIAVSGLDFDSLNKYEEHGVYDSCVDVRKNSLLFIEEMCESKSQWLSMIGNVNQKSWNSFMSCKGPGAACFQQPGAGNSAYYKAYVFLEKVRVYRGTQKSPKRVGFERGFEREFPRGFSLKHDNGKRWVEF